MQIEAEIQKLDLNPGDVVTVRLKERLTDYAEQQALLNELRCVLPRHVHILLLPVDAPEVGSLSEREMAGIGWVRAH